MEKVNIPIATDSLEAVELTFGMPASDSENAALLVDQFTITPGNLLILPANRGGSLVANPQKAAYANGDFVTIAGAANEGFRLSKLNLSNASIRSRLTPKPIYRETTSSSINHLINYHTEVSAVYDASLSCIGGQAWSLGDPASLYGWTGPLEDFVQQVSIEGLSQPGVLAFEALTPQARDIDFTPASGPFGQTKTLQIVRDGENYVPVQVAFEAAPQTIRMGEEYATTLKIRNLRFITEPQAFLSQIGLGNVSVTYQTSPEGQISATLNATPAEGWIFLGWRTEQYGDFIETDPSFTLELNHARTFHAVFGQTFEADGRTLAFVHGGKATITILESETGKTDYSIIGSSEHTGYDQDHPIELFIFDLPAGTLEREYYDGFNTESNTSSAFPNPYRLPSLLYPSYYEPTNFNFTITPLADLSTEIEIVAPAGSIDATPAPYSFGQTVELSVKPSFRSRFLGWRGDLYSDKPEVTTSASKNKIIAAVSEYDLPFTSPIAMKWTSPHLPSSTIANNTFKATINGSFESILSGHVDGPCILKFIRIGSGNAAPTRIVVPNQSPGEDYQLYPYLSGSEIRIPIESEGDFSITFSGSETPKLFSLQFAGVYQRVQKAYISKGGSVLMDQSGNGDFLVGSSIDFSFVPDEGFSLYRWSEPDLPATATSLTVELYKDILITPEVTFDSGFNQVKILPSSIESWTNLQNQTSDTLDLSLLVQGPGVLEFTVSDDQTVEAVTQNGPLQSTVDYGDQAYTLNVEYLLPSGESQLEVKVRQIKESGSNKPFRFPTFTFTPGYAIRKKSNALGDFTTTPSSTTNTFEPGSSVTLNAVAYPGNNFQKWTGDATGSSSSTQVVMNQHRIIAPTYSPTASISPTTFSISTNANTLAYSSDGSTSFAIAGSTQPTVFTFTIPAKYEFKFNLSGTFLDSATWTVSGESPREIYSESIVATAPANNQRTATLSVDMDPDSSDVLQLSNIKTQNTFILGGFFGPYTSNVLAEPLKDTYAWGEKVKISLDSSIASNNRFYDLATEYEGYETIDWSQTDFVREYQVVILGDTYLTGKIGPSFTRTDGQITSYPEEANRASNILDPYQRSARQLDPDAVHRIQTGNAHFLTFFIKVPAEDFIVLDSFSGANPIPIDGTGQWMQVGMPIPAGRTFAYFNIVDNGGAYNEPSYIAGIKTIAGYAPPYISFGPGQIVVEPSTGSTSPSGNVTLRAQPNSSETSHLWLTPSESDEPTIVEKANAILPIFAYFEEPEIETPVREIPFNLTAIGSAPEFTNKTESNPNQRIIFRSDPKTLVLPVHGPSTLLVDARIMHEANLELEIGPLRYQIETPDETGKTLSYLPLPAGITKVQLNYTSNTGFASTLYNLEEIDAFLVKAESPDATIYKYPDLPYYQPGQTITLLASPDDGFTFNSWIGASGNTSNPLQFTVTSHSTLTAQLEEKPVTNAENQTWRPLPSAEGSHSYETLVQGPGTLFLDLNHISGASLRIDGLPAQLHPTWPDKSYFLVPTGKHRLRLTQPQALGQTPLSFVPGFHIDLSPVSINPSVKITPRKTAYQAGDQITIDWPKDVFILDPNLQVLLEPFAKTVTLPYTFTVQDHVVGQAYALTPTAAENFLASDLLQLSNYNDSVNYLAGKNLTEGLKISFDHSALHLRLAQGGTLNFNFGREFYNEIDHGSVSLNGQHLQYIESGNSYQLNIPSGGGLITWNTSTYGQSNLEALRFTPTSQSDPFAALLESLAPTAAFVTSSAIGPDDDLDGDGATNQFEINRGTNPGVFDLWIWTTKGDETPSQTLARFNKLKSPANRFQTLPNECLDLVLANQSEFLPAYSNPSIYALTVLPANTAIESLSVQLGNADPETGQILWTLKTLDPVGTPVSITANPRLIRLEINDLSDLYPLVRFVQSN